MRRVAIIGAGRTGLAHAKAWQSLDRRAAVVMVASRRPVEWVADIGATQTADLEAAIADPRVDVVDICLPTLLHAPTVSLALDAGKHVLCEKPLSLDVASSDALVEAAARASSALMVAHVVRFFPGYMKVREIVESGRLGKPVSLTAHRLAAGSRDIAWLRDASQSGGVAVDLLVHDYDQANLLLGRPQRVFARMRGAEGVSVTIEHEGGRVAAVEGSTAMPAGFPFSTGIRVHCEGGVVEHMSPGHAGAPVVTVWEPDSPPETLAVAPADPYAAQAAYFLDRLDDRAPVDEGSPAQARSSVAVAAAAVRSASSDLPEPV